MPGASSAAARDLGQLGADVDEVDDRGDDADQAEEAEGADGREADERERAAADHREEQLGGQTATGDPEPLRLAEPADRGIRLRGVAQRVDERPHAEGGEREVDGGVDESRGHEHPVSIGTVLAPLDRSRNFS